MNIDLLKEDKSSIALLVSGELSIYSAVEFKRVLNEYYEITDNLVVDLSGIEEMDTSCFQILIALKNDRERTGKKVSFVNHSHSVLKFIDLYGLANFFGDRIKLGKDEREMFEFAYGVKTEKEGVS